MEDKSKEVISKHAKRIFCRKSNQRK